MRARVTRTPIQVHEKDMENIFEGPFLMRHSYAKLNFVAHFNITQKKDFPRHRRN